MPKSTVLIVDDRPANLLALEEVLSTYQNEEDTIETLCASSAEEALRTLLETKVDLILLDVQMPGMDGYEAASIISKNPRTRSIPIIFVSAVYGDERHIARGYEGGAVDFILKPINPHLLMAKVGNLLRVQRAIRKALEVEREKEALLEATRLKSEFLMNTNHELRTPMNGVLGMADLLLTTSLNGEQKEYVETIKSSAVQILHIIQGMFDVARLEFQRLDLVVNPVCLPSLVADVVALYRFPIESKNLALEVIVECPEAFQWVQADIQRIKQVMMILLSNALKFTEKGKICLRLFVRPIGSERVQASVMVEDTGIGISESQKKNLFQLFSQGDGSGKKKYAGTGLGLIIVKRLVELMGGTLQWESAEGTGSRFQVNLPFDLVAENISKPSTETNYHSDTSFRTAS